MKKLILLISVLLIVLANLTYGQVEKIYFKNTGWENKDNVSKFLKDYELAKKEFNLILGRSLQVYADLKLGIGSTNANISSKSGTGDYGTSSKLGYTVGALFYFNIFELFNFSSGLIFNGKSFSITTPATVVDTGTVRTNNSSYITNNYLDIPLNFNVGGMITERVGLWFNGGPYLGILLSSPNENTNGMGYKNFDLGLNGTLTANYVIFYPFSAILGVNFCYGGLNNLGSTKYVDKINTINYSFFTGLRFEL